MAEYVEREALITKFKKMELGEHGLVERLFADGVYAVIAAFPAADVAPVVHGCFEPCFDENGNWRQGFAKCSNCGKEYYAQVINHFGYCPNCGAKMDGGADNGNA